MKEEAVQTPTLTTTTTATRKAEGRVRPRKEASTTLEETGFNQSTPSLKKVKQKLGKTNTF